MIAETKQVLLKMEDLHKQVSSIIKPLDATSLNWRPIEGHEEFATNSLAALAAHIAGSEHFWIGEVVGRLPATRDRDAEFAMVANNPEELVSELARVMRESSNILSAVTATEIEEEREVRGEKVLLRWCLLHVLHHTSLHIGHMQLTIQLLNHEKSIS